jgi:3-oxoacyl-[acyl-carrier-protein] synthase II
MLAGGAESPLQPLIFGAFSIIRAISYHNDAPEKASRPFDRERDGFVMSEGAGVLVLEDLEHALRRGAPIYCEVLGYATTNDAHHMTAPLPGGAQAARAMREALADAGCAPDAIEYINAHGSSTPLNDKTETLAIRQVFGAHADRVPVSGTKGMHGHALGTSGAWEAIACALSLDRGWLPPCVNLDHPDPECDLPFITGSGLERRVNTILSNSFGFGGINVSLIFGRVTR